ncbi:hypothetical protein NUU61_005366 [Penicillium alfredii]|uniref:Acyltransferase 3 domain-containing protein n=1 Tax=Penicillium alfredii TaxID=1506179 RepID=A0A9W9F9I3_9EURO|nr:uncharacterized protein NUU61_005366 [Penicillium alfredii]KAJ5096010.1 hypothetical protein NUU61_005366 [Penicillium alfredii]
MPTPAEGRASTSAAAIPLSDLESGARGPYRSNGSWKSPLRITACIMTLRTKDPEPAKLHAIGALDGLRGWACMLVFNFHFLFTYTWTVSAGWGFTHKNVYIHQLPILHMLISGHIMVAIFFVISGYVLSYKPLKTMRNRSFDQTFTTLASATFRRAMRLYIPAICGLACVLVAVRCGLYDRTYDILMEGHTVIGTNEEHPPAMETLEEQWWDVYYTLTTLADPFDWKTFYNNYNPHLWTIPVEFRSSIVLFLTLLATSRLMPAARMTLVGCLIWFCSRYGRWDIIIFLSGMLMAEVDLMLGTWERPAGGPQDHPEEKMRLRLRSGSKIGLRIPRRFLWLAIFTIGLYIGSSPNIGYKWTPGYHWLWRLTPVTYGEPHRFPQTIGALIIVFSINHSPDLQKLFTHPLSQYVGKISFAFYVVHGPILHSFGYSLMPTVWKYTGKQDDFHYCLGLLIGWLICLPLCIWAGDLFWRVVDVPSVKFTRWVENSVLATAAPASATPSGQEHRQS